VTLIEPVRRRVFDCCPICGDPATSEAHVPPDRLGGRFMTKTFLACNNKLGSNVEADLVDWFEGAITLPSFRSADVHGPRREKRVLFRTTPDGESVLVFDVEPIRTSRRCWTPATLTLTPCCRTGIAARWHCSNRLTSQPV
jgi:hypothetical protein